MQTHPSLARTLIGRLFLACLLAAAVFALLVARGLVAVPAAYNPFLPLDVRDEPNWLTAYKLQRLERDGAECLSVLASSPLSFSPIPDQATGEGCGFANAVSVERSASVAFNAGFRASCPVATSWALFELHVLQNAALQHLGRRVVRVDHFGTYACRNLYHRSEGRRSEHATANAIDISGFVLADGETVSVLRDWRGDARKAAFLSAVRDGACRFFDVVLSPDYNEAHRDHFHFDKGNRSACR